MTVLRLIQPFFAVAMLALAGCGGGDSVPAAAEIDDPYYRQGQQLVKQGRTQEALSAYLKAIERRGGQSSAESHLEAGLIYLQHSKDPMEAYHHFRQYLLQQPNSRNAARVSALVNTAKRESARTLSGGTADNQGARTELFEQIDRLQRDNDRLQREGEALRAELAALRSGAAVPVSRTIRTPVSGERTGVRAVVPESAQVIAVEEQSPISLAPTQRDAPPPAVSRPPAGLPVRSAPVRPGASGTAVSAPRRHTVAQGDTLFGIAKQYYGAASTAKVDAIYEANRDVMKHTGDIRPGMEIKIP